MRIMNNMSSIAALGEMKKNDKAFGKAMKKLASGMKLNSAGDGAAEYSISENMRVRLRCLGQDSENVQKGKSMLQVAEGAVQSQINLLRTIKERVINAHNDTNTDVDRQIIQKEINQYYDEINDIAAETEFNGKHILTGTTVTHTFESWVVLDEAVPVEGSDTLGIIHDAVHEGLDGQEGKFATFGSASDPVPWDGYKMTIGDIMNLKGSEANTNNKLHGGTPNTANTIEFDLSGYTKDTLSDVSFQVYTPSSDPTFVLSKDSSKHYQYGNVINTSSCSSASALASTIKSALESNSAVRGYYDISISGTKITLKTKADGLGTNDKYSYDIKGITIPGGDKPGTSSGVNRTGAPASGVSKTGFSGGANEVTKSTWHPGTSTYDPETDKTITTPGYYTYETVTPAKSATATVSGIGSAADGSGITVNIGGTPVYFMFKDGSGGVSKKTGESGYYYTVGKNATSSITIAGTQFKFDNGKLTMIASPGSGGNSYSISDGITASTATTTPGVTGYYTATTPLPTGTVNNKQEGANGERAHWDLDFSAYSTSDEDKVNEFIKSYVGKTLTHSNYGGVYEFIDSGSDSTADAIQKVNGSNKIDLAAVRTYVTGGKTLAEAMATVIKNRVSYADYIREDPADPSSAIIGVKFNATVYGEDGNKQSMGSGQGEMRHFDINFKEWADGKSNIPAELDQKGFRFYCATDASQWVNVLFINGTEGLDTDKPPSGTATQDIETLMIDVSGVKDYKELTKLVDDKLEDYLTNEYKHFFHSMADLDSGVLTIYDSRKFYLLNDPAYKNKQEKGAKIADGILDNVVKDYRYLYANRLIIHHTDESSNNIKIDIPQTSMDQIYGYKKENYEPEHFNVLTKGMRERLLGWDSPGEKGIIDKGIEYLTDAQTLIGSQINHMEFADANITTMAENTTAAESVIRDSDMAKEYCEFSKASILTQTAQTMLAQSNQNAGRAVELLQGV